MSYFDNIYILDSCSLSKFRLSINLINAITPAGPVSVGIMAVCRAESILNSDFEKINNKADIFIKRSLVTMGHYDKDVLNNCCRKFVREIRNYYELGRNDFGMAIIVMTAKIRYVYKWGKGCKVIRKKGLMIYTDNVLNTMDVKSVRRLVKIKDSTKRDRYAKELIDRCRSRGEKDDMGIICICPKIPRRRTDWFRWPWQGL